jgi:hypothetical protein
MHAAPLTAVGLLAHAVHVGLVVGGAGGVVALLAPGWRSSHVERRAQRRASAPEQRIDAVPGAWR